MISVIDLSGYMFSGKAALSDLLGEISGLHVPDNRQEFDLLRIGGGLIDLKLAINDWSPVRSHAALNRFERVIRSMALCSEFPSKYYRSGFSYAERFPNILSELEIFLSRITALEWQTSWPFQDIEDGPVDTFFRKVRGRFGQKAFHDYRLIARNEFLPAAQAFVRGILVGQNPVSDRRAYLTHNALEPFAPHKHLDLLGEGSKCIVVDRDPRDIYATAFLSEPHFNPNPSSAKRIVGAHDIDVFIKRYRIYRSNVELDCRDRVLRITFEDLIFRYESTLELIYGFLGVDSSCHAKKGRFFDPQRSRANALLWQREELASLSSDFRKIEKECM